MRAAQMNNRRNKNGFNRQRNDIQFSNASQRDQFKYPTRKVRMGGNRHRNNNNVRPNGRQFELNRNRASGVRQRIQFNNANNTHSRQFNGRNQNRVGRHRQRVNNPNRWSTTIRPTIWPSTTVWNYPTTLRPTTMMTRPSAIATQPPPPPLPSTTPPVTQTITYAPPHIISNEVTQYNDDQYRQQIEEAERLRQEEKSRKKQADHLWRMEQERLKKMRQHDLEERRQKEASENHRAHENEPFQNERRQPDRRERNEYTTVRGFTQQRQQQQPNIYTEPTQQHQNQQRQRHQQNEQISDEHAVQTNEVYEGPVTTTTTPSPAEEKKLRLRLLHERLKKLSPEEQQKFFEERRARNRNKKRDH